MAAKKNGVIGKWALVDLRQGGTQLFRGLFVADRLQGPGPRFCRQDPFYRLAVIGAIAAGMAKSHIDVVRMIVFFLVQDIAGVKARVLRLRELQPPEEFLCMTAQL